MKQCTKLQITSEEDTLTYEKGKDGIRGISIDEENQMIIIYYDKTVNWDNMYIPFHSFDYFYTQNFEKK